MSTRSHFVYIYMCVAKGTTSTSLKGRENIYQAPSPFPMCLSFWQIIGKGLLRLEGHFLFSLYWINFNVVNLLASYLYLCGVSVCVHTHRYTSSCSWRSERDIRYLFLSFTTFCVETWSLTEPRIYLFDKTSQ